MQRTAFPDMPSTFADVIEKPRTNLRELNHLSGFTI